MAEQITRSPRRRGPRVGLAFPPSVARDRCGSRWIAPEPTRPGQDPTAPLRKAPAEEAACPARGRPSLPLFVSRLVHAELGARGDVILGPVPRIVARSCVATDTSASSGNSAGRETWPPSWLEVEDSAGQHLGARHVFVYVEAARCRNPSRTVPRSSPSTAHLLRRLSSAAIDSRSSSGKRT